MNCSNVSKVLANDKFTYSFTCSSHSRCKQYFASVAEGANLGKAALFHYCTPWHSKLLLHVDVICKKVFRNAKGQLLLCCVDKTCKVTLISLPYIYLMTL